MRVTGKRVSCTRPKMVIREQSAEAESGIVPNSSWNSIGETTAVIAERPWCRNTLGARCKVGESRNPSNMTVRALSTGLPLKQQLIASAGVLPLSRGTGEPVLLMLADWAVATTVPPRSQSPGISYTWARSRAAHRVGVSAAVPTGLDHTDAGV